MVQKTMGKVKTRFATIIIGGKKKWRIEVLIVAYIVSYEKVVFLLLYLFGVHE